jgi:hypothetical protein
MTYLVYASLALPAAAASAWAIYRCSGPLVLDALDADEMMAAAVHRLVSAGYALFAVGVALAMGPGAHDLRNGTASALGSAWAGLLILLGLFHLGALAVFARMRAAQRNRDLGPPRWYAGPTPTVGAPPPMFSAPPPFVPPSGPPSFGAPSFGAPSFGSSSFVQQHRMPPPQVAAPSAYPPPGFVAGSAFTPPSPPWWCSPVPLSYDAWTPPQR